MPTPRATLVQLLGVRARTMPERRAFVFLRDGEVEHTHLTFGQLDERARAIGATLQRLNARGERALLLYPTSLEFVAAFFGCLYAGVVAVPVYPPGLWRLQWTAPRLAAIAADSQARLVLTTSQHLSLAEPLAAYAPDFDALRWIATDTLPDALAGGWIEPHADEDALAFLQYTSGSTAAPKGVMVSHRNVLHNEACIQRKFRLSSESVGVAWLPLYHDMGLIGNVLQVVYSGGSCVLMPPETVVQRPARWLRAIARYRATISGGPNFAYDHAVRRLPAVDRETLDLASWAVAYNGAEPVRADTLARFAAAFGPCGFRAEAFYPCYGLAEATLFVTGGRTVPAPIVKRLNGDALERHEAVDAHAGAADDDVAGGRVRPVVSCGESADDTRVIVVDPDAGIACPRGRVGEIWIAGPSVAGGYWNQPEETARVFRASLTDTGEGPFLRTGDLGFVEDGELFVTGRLKDLVIIDGRNHYPQDIECTVAALFPALRPGGCVAFTVEAEGEPRLVVVVEASGASLAAASAGGPGRESPIDFEAVVTTLLRRVVSDAHGVHVHAIGLLKPGSIPRTSSGKVRRQACRAQYVAGALTTVAGGADGPPA